MNFLESVPAIRRIESDRADLFAIDVVGQVSSADAENLYGLLEAAYALHPRIDVLVRMVDMDGVDWAEISPETMEQAKSAASQHVVRCATVGGVKTPMLGVPAPPDGIEARQFGPDEEQAAWEWLGAKAQPADV